jgi:transcriptional regulator with XRE-family HTH domain
MRGIQVDVQRFRQLRRARGLTQPELARIAGVSERTVRNAELGRRIRLDFLRFLAAALGVEAVDVAQHPEALRLQVSAEKLVGHILQALDVLGNKRDFSEFRSLLSHRARIVVPAPSEVPFAGEFQGYSQIQKFFDISSETTIYEQPPVVSEIRSSGNFVIMSGREALHVPKTGKTFVGLWQHIYEFEKGFVIRLDCQGDGEKLASAFRYR